MALTTPGGLRSGYGRVSALLALAPNMAAGALGRRLMELAASMDGEILGRCLVREADVDALALLDEARELGVKHIYVVSPCSRINGIEAEAYEPMGGAERAAADGRATVLLVRELWMNLTGSLGPEDWAAALRVLSPRPFLVIRLGEGGFEKLLDAVGALCGARKPGG